MNRLLAGLLSFGQLQPLIRCYVNCYTHSMIRKMIAEDCVAAKLEEYAGMLFMLLPQRLHSQVTWL